MRTNIVQAVGGQIYVAPTFVATSNTTIICSSCETNKVNFTISDSNAITQLTYGGANWYNGSKIKFTGKITSNKITDNPPIIAFNSADGTLTSNMNASSGKLTISVNYDGIGTYFTNSANNLTYSDMSVMMYQIRNNNVDYPVGIYIKSYGSDNKNSYIDVYGGTTTAPNVRLGLLNGLKDPDNPTQDLTIDGDVVRGWGLMTNSGYFKGKIISHSGKIGGWTLGQTTLSSNTLGTDNSMWLTTADVTAASIGGSSSLTTWRIAAGSKFGVTSDGTLYASNLKASGGTIGGWTIGTSSLYSGSHSAYNSNNDGIFMDSTYLAGGKQAAWYLKNDGSAKIGAMTLTAAGVLSVPAANISGELSASQIAVDAIKSRTYTYSSGNFSTAGIQFNLTGNGYIRSKNFAIDSSGNAYFSAGYFGGTSGFTVAAGKMYSGTKSTLTSNTVNGVYVGTDGIALGQGKFKVTNEGVLDATSGSIGNWSITDTQIYKSVITGGYEYRPILNAPTSISAATSAFTIGTRTNNGNGTTGDWSYPFAVSYDGSMTATKGKIGEWNIDDYGLYNTSSNDRFSNNVYIRPDKFKFEYQKKTNPTYGSLFELDMWNFDLYPIITFKYINTNATVTSTYSPNQISFTSTTSEDAWATYGAYSCRASQGTFTGAYVGANGLEVNGSIKAKYLELSPGVTNAGHGGCIDFHFNASTNDYTTRLYESASGTLRTTGSFITGGNITALSGSSLIAAQNSSCGNVYCGVHASSAGNVGIWTNGYWNGSKIAGSGNWLIYRNTADKPIINNYLWSASFPVVSDGTNGHIVVALRTSAASTFGVRAQWASTGTADSNFTWKNVTTSASDIRLKTNIAPTKRSGLDLINNINLYSFDWTDHPEHWDIGFIADYLEEIDPLLSVGGGYAEDGSMDIKTVNSFYLQGYEVKAIQELSAENKELRNKITSLEARIASLEALIK